MKKRRVLRDGGFTLLMVTGAFGLDLLFLELFDSQSNVESVFVLGVFLVSWLTEGYLWGIAASLVSVLAVNYAFTYPYWAFDLMSPECISAAVIMFIVAIITSTLTTQIKQQEKLRAEAEKERMRGNLLRAVSHDLRTPLTSIYGACSALEEGYDAIPREKQLKMLRDIRSDAQWLVRMVENLLSVTRVNSASVKLSKHDTVLDELMDAVLVKFHKHYPDQEVILTIPDQFITIPMDPLLIEQVLMNLLENALFHGVGMRHLWLTVTTKGSTAVFTVADDGCGIPENRLGQLFTGNLNHTERDIPGDTSRSSMGIGLSVCRAIIRAHGGDIWAGNRPSGGAQFRFTLEMEDEHGK